MNPWYVLVFVAIIGAMATQILNRFFAISSARPPFADKLIKNINETLNWMENPDTTFGARDDVSSEAFCNFVSSCWPLQQMKLIRLWNDYYHETGGATAKVQILRDILVQVKQYSGFV